MKYESTTPGGCKIIRRTEYSESQILDHFNEHIEIRQNGELIKSKALEVSNQQTNTEPIKFFTSGDQNAPSIDVMDPSSFFGNSLGDVASKLNNI